MAGRSQINIYNNKQNKNGKKLVTANYLHRERGNPGKTLFKTGGHKAVLSLLLHKYQTVVRATSGKNHKNLKMVAYKVLHDSLPV